MAMTLKSVSTHVNNFTTFEYEVLYYWVVDEIRDQVFDPVFIPVWDIITRRIRWTLEHVNNFNET